MVKKYKAALIGTGRIGFSLQMDKKREQPASHSSALTANKRIELVCACDTGESSLERFKKHYRNCRIYSDPAVLFEKENPDIIVIAVNEESHLEVFETAVKRKPKLIILEKPVAPNLKDAEKIAALSKRYKVPVSINHERRFSADYIEAKKLIDSGRLGDIQNIRSVFSSNIPVYVSGSEKDGSCSLIHDGTHLVDIMIFLSGVVPGIPVVRRVVKNRKGNITVLEINFEGKIKHGGKNKTSFDIELNGMRKYFGFDIEVAGTHGKILIGNGYFKFYERKQSPFYKGFYSLVKDVKIKRLEKTGYFSNMVQNCVDFLDGKADLVSPLKEGLKTLGFIFSTINRIKKK